MIKLFVTLISIFTIGATFANYQQQQQSSGNGYYVQIIGSENQVVQELACTASQDECVDVDYLKSQSHGGWVANPIILNWSQVQDLEGQKIKLKLKIEDEQYEFDRTKYEMVD